MSKKDAEVQEKAQKKGQKADKKPEAKVKAAAPGEKIKYIVRIAGTDLDGQKKLKIVLPKIKGVGYNFSNAILRAMNLDDNTMTGKLTDEQIASLEAAVKNPASIGIPPFMFDRQKDPVSGEDAHWAGSEWSYGQKETLDFLEKVKTYRGVRHLYGLKVRGQRTKSRGGGQGGRKGKTIGVVRKKLAPGQQPAKKGEEKK